MKKQPKRTKAQINLAVKAEAARFEIETHLTDIDEVYKKYADEPTRQALGAEWLRGFAAGKGVEFIDVLRLIDETAEVPFDRGQELGIVRGKATLH